MTADWVRRPAVASAWLSAAVLGTALNLRAAVTSVGALLPEVQSALAMGPVQAGVLTSLPVFSFALVALVANRFARRFGLVSAMTLSMVAVSSGLVLRVAVLDGTWLIVTSLVALSGMAIGNVLLPVAVRTWFPDRVGAMTGWYALMIAASTGLPAAVSVPIATGLGGWRPGLAVWAVPAALSLVPWLLALRARGQPSADRYEPLRPTAVEVDTAPADGDTGERAAAAVGAPGDGAGEPDPAGRVGSVHRRVQSWALAVFFGVQALEAYVLMGWLPSILREAGVAPGAAGAMTGVAMIIGGPVALVLPRLASRDEDQRIYVVGLIALSVAGYLGLLFAPAAQPLLWTVLLGLGLGAFPLALLLIGVRAATTPGTAQLSVLVQSFGYLVAGLGPVTIGALRGWSGGWSVPLTLLLLLLIPKLIGGVIAASPGKVDVDIALDLRRDVLRGLRADRDPPPMP